MGEAAKKAKDELGATIVGKDDFYGVECDIFAPCALGGILNDQTIPQLKCQIVVGAANNQLSVDERDGLGLAPARILPPLLPLILTTIGIYEDCETKMRR